MYDAEDDKLDLSQPSKVHTQLKAPHYKEIREKTTTTLPPIPRRIVESHLAQSTKQTQPTMAQQHEAVSAPHPVTTPQPVEQHREIHSTTLHAPVHGEV